MTGEGGTIRLERAGAVATLVLDNAGARNAMTPQMWHRVPALVAEIKADADVRVVAVRGEGEHFCSGVDIRQLDETLFGQGPFGAVVSAAEAALAGLRMPTVAVIDGACVGGGWQLAGACDIRIASTSARFGVTPAKLGITLPFGGVDRLVRLLGPAVAKRLLLTGEILSAQHAAQLGMVTDVVPQRELSAEAGRLIASMAELSLFSLHAAKASIDAYGDGPRFGRSAELLWSERVRTGGHHREGVSAFIEGRTPSFDQQTRQLARTA